MRAIIEDYWRDAHIKAGYELVYTPHAAKRDLWETSGHVENYSENMFGPMELDNDKYQLRPMNCPGHILIYADAGKRSYRELPIRYAELGTVYRYERSGTLHGLFRARGFTQDDGHIFCRPDQIVSEVRGALDLVESMMAHFGFHELTASLSTRPKNTTTGSDESWASATSALIDALNSKGWEYEVDEGGGAFYGPKIDIQINDAIGRMWQCSTIQLDFNLPALFRLRYVDSEKEYQEPVLIHRAIFGSLERFFGILTESCAGDFPLWLAPVQCRVLPVSEAQHDSAVDVVKLLRAAGIRAETPGRDQRLGKAMRNAVMDKIPIMAVLGSKEVANRTLSIRTRSKGKVGELNIDDVIARINASVCDHSDF